VAGVLLGGALLAGCGAKTKQAELPGATPGTTSGATARATPQGTLAAAATPSAAKTKKPPAGWQSFVSQEGGYTIWMPGQVSTKTTPVPTELGTITAHLASVTRKNGALLVIYADYPAVALKANPQKILAGARSGAVKRLGGQLQGEQKITINGFPGLAFSALATAGKEKSFMQAHVYLVRQRLYQLIVVGPQKEKSADEIKTFFNSFTIQAKKP
jgi:hypothetical protein